MEFYDGSAAAAALCASFGDTCEWGYGSIDESNADVECIDGSDSVSSASIDSSGLFQYDNKSECDGEPLCRKWSGVEYAVLLARECFERRWDECVFECVELYDGDDTCWSCGSVCI